MVRVEDGIWNIQTALGSPCASSVRVPADILNDEISDLYTPGKRVVVPPNSPGIRTKGLPAASTIAAAKLTWPASAAAFSSSICPVTLKLPVLVISPNGVKGELQPLEGQPTAPGLIPTFPAIVVLPVLVIDAPAKTA